MEDEEEMGGEVEKAEKVEQVEMEQMNLEYPMDIAHSKEDEEEVEVVEDMEEEEVVEMGGVALIFL